MGKHSIGIVGGGIAGLSTALRLRKFGHEITVYDPSPTMGASYAAAGMLAPASEIDFGELPLLHLMQLSNTLWPDFAGEVEQASNVPVGFRNEGTIVIGYDRNDAEDLERLAEFQQQLGIPVERISRARLKELEPDLTSPVASAHLIPSDNQVDNRALLKSLIDGLSALGTVFNKTTVKGLKQIDGQRYSLQLIDGKEVRHDIILLAPGSKVADLAGIPEPLQDAVRPVKGQIIRVQIQQKVLIRRVIRSKIFGQNIYLVPRTSGEIVIGATQEEVGYDRTAKVRAIAELLTNATRLVPAIGEADFIEHTVRFRPGSKDNAPVVGQYEKSNLYVSLGHFRHGILLAPAISYFLARSIHTGNPALELEPFALSRLETSGATS